MVFQVLEMLWYTTCFLIAGGWVLSMIVPGDTHPALGRALGIGLAIGCLVIGYLMAFEKAPEQDCRSAGPSIYNDC